MTVISAALALVGCAPEKFDAPICVPPSFESSTPEQPPFASGYFPAEYAEPSLRCGFGNDLIPIVSEIESEWYPRQWQAALEPSFYEAAQCQSLPDFALRFSYIPSFNPSVFIRVQSDEEGFKLIAKELTGAGGYEPGNLGRSKELRLSDQQASELRRILESERLFDEPPDNCRLGFDGSQWIFELVDRDGYHMVKRWSPDEGAAYNLGKYLVKLTGWRIDTY